MALTEVALELADERVALCRHTMAPRAAHGMYRILDDGRLSRRYVALVTFVGPRDAAQELMRDMARERPAIEVETVAQDAESTTFRTSMPLDPQDVSQSRLHAVLRLFDRLGPDVVVDPILFRGGRMRARILVPRIVESPAVHAAVAEAQQLAGFRDLRLLRVARVDPDRHIEVMRPLLNPEQEGLLRLAVAMGYYTNPKRATLEDISARVGLSISPIHKRLKAAEEMLVAAHVGVAARGGAAVAIVPARRRVRRRPGAGARTGACEVDLVARLPQHPIARFTRANRGARVLMQPSSEDSRTGVASWLLLCSASRAQVDALVEALGAEPGVRVEEVAREDAHATLRVQGPSENGWGSSPLAAAFGATASIRRLVFDGDETYARVLLATPEPMDDLEARLAKVLVGLGWQDHEILAVITADATRVPADLPEPLSARQEEVLKVAHALGYYRTPRGCTLEQVASTLGVSANAIHKNLVGAEARIIAHYLVAGF